MMQITRVYSDDNGDSRFEEISIPLNPSGDIGALSERYTHECVTFRGETPGYDYDFHTAPDRQFIILLDGETEIEAPPGEKRRFGAGEILLMEDVTGKGHKTRNLQKIRRKSIFIVLPEDLQIP